MTWTRNMKVDDLTAVSVYKMPWPAEIKYRALNSVVSAQKNAGRYYVSFQGFKDNTVYDCSRHSCTLVGSDAFYTEGGPNDTYPSNHQSYVCVSNNNDRVFKCEPARHADKLILTMKVLRDVVPGLISRTMRLIEEMSGYTVRSLVLTMLKDTKGVYTDAGGGGDCLFHTFARILDKCVGLQLTHKQMRATLLDYIDAHKYELREALIEEYIDNFDDEVEVVSQAELTTAQYKKWHTKLSKQGEWGGSACKYAFANKYRINLQELVYPSSVDRPVQDLAAFEKDPDLFNIDMYKVNDDNDYVMFQFVKGVHFRPIAHDGTPIHSISDQKKLFIRSSTSL